MTAELQKAMDYTVRGLQITYCFLADIKTASTGSESNQLNYVIKRLKKLYEDNLPINLQKCHFDKTEIDLLSYNFTQTCIPPLENKPGAILEIPPPSTLKRLRSFLGSVHYNSKFKPNLAQLCHPLRPLLTKSTKFLWTEIHTKDFNIVKDKITKSTENCQYNSE